jgi:hypothetical protein
MRPMFATPYRNSLRASRIIGLVAEATTRTPVKAKTDLRILPCFAVRVRAPARLRANLFALIAKERR